MFPVYGFRLTIFRPFGEHLPRGVVDNFKITSHKVTSWNIYQWGTCTGAIGRLRFEIVNIEIMQHVFVIKKKLTLLVWYKHTKL
jgi:hypothetical protein